MQILDQVEANDLNTVIAMKSARGDDGKLIKMKKTEEELFVDSML